MYSSYGELCTEVYDLSKPLGHSFGDIEFYYDRLKNINGKVLELGCGSGRVLIPLLQAGIDADGLDNSASMLDSCRRRCEELKLTTDLYQDEMDNFKISNTYQSIIIPGGSFQLLEGRDRALATLNHIYKYLKPGGSLIMDLFIPTDLRQESTSIRTWETPNNEVITLEDKRIELNLNEQKIVSLLKYEKWKYGKLIQSELQRFPLSWYGNYEFELILEKLGYQEIVKSADYKFMNRPRMDGKMITYEAKKV